MGGWGVSRVRRVECGAVLLSVSSVAVSSAVVVRCVWAARCRPFGGHVPACHESRPYRISRRVRPVSSVRLSRKAHAPLSRQQRENRTPGFELNFVFDSRHDAR